MITATATEVQNDFEKYLQMVQSGDEIAITSNGKEVARLVPYMKLDGLPDSKAVRAMKSASHIAEENGIADMTLEDINAEIAEARKRV